MMASHENQQITSYQGHEMTNPPYRAHSAELLNNKQRVHSSARPLPRQNSKIRDFFRHIRLHLPSFLAGRNLSFMSPDEQPKVAAYQSRRMAFLNILIHVIPLCGSAVLLLLYWGRIWAGRATDNGTTLQFVAKLHELFMQASLVDIILYLIRAQALDDFVPLGALTAAAGQQLSFLWSLEFLSAVVSPVFSTWRKVHFTLSMITLFVMTAVVGPSSAVLMIPRPGGTHVNSTLTHYLNVSEESLYPDTMANPMSLNFSQFYESTMVSGSSLGRGDRVLFRDVLRDDRQATGGFMRWQRYSVSRAAADGKTSWTTDGEYYIATVPTVLSAAFLFYNNTNVPSSQSYDLDTLNANWTLRAWQPLVLSACADPDPQTGLPYYLTDDGSRRLLPNAKDLLSRTEKYWIEGNRNFAPGWKYVYRPRWIPSPEGSPSVVGIFAHEREAAAGKLITGVTICTVSSFWRKSVTTLTVTPMGPMVEADLVQTREGMRDENLKPITFNVDDMLLHSGDSLLGSGSIREVDTWGNPGLLGITFALALSTLHYTATDARQINRTIATNPSLDNIKEADRQNLTFFKIEELVEGYSYGSTDTSILLSLAVIILYCAITLTYMFYLIATGHTSTAWSSATEFIMLALQSQPADNVKNVSVGIDTMNTFRRSVGIRVKEEINEYSEQIEEKLELVFADEKDVQRRGLRKVVRNKAY